MQKFWRFPAPENKQANMFLFLFTQTPTYHQKVWATAMHATLLQTHLATITNPKMYAHPTMTTEKYSIPSLHIYNSYCQNTI